MTDCSSRNICVFASAFSRMLSRRERSSFILMIRSSLVIVLLCLGTATASKISSSSEILKAPLDLLVSKPLRARKASAASPSSTEVNPPRDMVGDIIPLIALIEDMRRSFRSMALAMAVLPSSHSCISALRSTPIDSYCSIRFGPISDNSMESSSALSDSSPRTCSFA